MTSSSALSPADVLHRAVEVARTLPPGSADHISAVHRVALAALQLDDNPLVEALLGELESPAHRAHVYAAMARRWDSRGGLEAALDHARNAVVALGRPGRWRPVLPDWVGPDSARADLCDLLVQLGDDRAAAAVAGAVKDRSEPKIRTIAALSHLLSAEDGWDTVCDAVGALASADDRARAALAVLETGRPGPRLGPEAANALRLIDAVVGREPSDASHLGGARVAMRLSQVLLQVPALTAAVEAWARALDLAHTRPVDDVEAVHVVCTVARDQLERVGPGPALVTWQGMLDRLAYLPLPPDPPQRGPWAEVLRVGLDHPALASPLSRVVAQHTAVPSAWAHALGLLHLRAGRPDRALRVADVLSKAAERHEEDLESMLLAGLLRARAGEGEAAWPDLLGALGGKPALAWLAWSDGPRRYEDWAVEALIAGGSTDLALLLARMVEDAATRARLLARCLASIPAGEGAVAVAEEAVVALVEARDAGEAVPLDPWLARLPAVILAGGDTERAEAVLGQLVGDLIGVSAPAWSGGATHIHTMLADLGPAAAAISAPWRDGWERRVDAADPEEQVELVLDWLRLLAEPSTKGGHQGIP